MAESETFEANVKVWMLGEVDVRGEKRQRYGIVLVGKAADDVRAFAALGFDEVKVRVEVLRG
jgi:hypothetical protein